jgi:hypothetical protein
MKKFTDEFYQTDKELPRVFLSLFREMGREGMLPDSFYEACIT